MVALLDATTAPKTVAQFLALVKIGFYDGKTFHRVEPELVIQGGCPNANGTGGIVTKVEGEFKENGWENDIKHRKGVIAMARGEDPDSASCQFYICNDNSYELDGQYATFGYIVEGLSVIDAITADKVQYGDSSNYYIIKDKTVQPVIKYMKVIESWSPAE
jgi:peptidyl-prolyl cis-trans isomerase B (cyclophilin B)